MKNINYFLLLYCIPTLLHAAAKETSPEKHVTFKRGADAEEPLLQGEQPLMHMARSVSSDGLPVEGGMRMQRMAPVIAVVPEEPDAARSPAPRSGRRAASQAFTFEAGAIEDAPVIGRPRQNLKLAPSPRSSVGVGLKSPSVGVRSVAPSPRAAGSRRGSRDSGDDPEIRAFIQASCNVAGKSTPNTREHFRRIAERVAINRDAVGRSDTTIDGDPLSDDLYVDSATLNTHVPSREGSVAGPGDVAQRKLIPIIAFDDTRLTSERIKYLKNLKAAERYYSRGLRSFSPSYISASDADKREALLNKLTDIFHGYYYGTDTLFEQIMEVDERIIVERDLQEADQLGCCAGCCSSCVIL